MWLTRATVTAKTPTFSCFTTNRRFNEAASSDQIAHESANEKGHLWVPFFVCCCNNVSPNTAMQRRAVALMQQNNHKAKQNDILESLARFLAVFSLSVVALHPTKVACFANSPNMQDLARRRNKHNRRATTHDSVVLDLAVNSRCCPYVARSCFSQHRIYA